MDGVVVYLNANPDLAPVLEKLEPMGGKVLMPKTQITPEIGWPFFDDTGETGLRFIHNTDFCFQSYGTGRPPICRSLKKFT